MSRMMSEKCFSLSVQRFGTIDCFRNEASTQLWRSSCPLHRCYCCSFWEGSKVPDKSRRELRNVFFDGAYVIRELREQTSVTVSVRFCWFYSVIYKIYSWLKRDYRKCLKEPNNIQTASAFNQSPSTPKSCHLADTLKSCQELNWAANFTFT